MHQPDTRHWLLIVEGDVEPFIVGPLQEPELLASAREHRANDPSAEDGLYALSLDATGDLRIDALASGALEPQE